MPGNAATLSEIVASTRSPCILGPFSREGAVCTLTLLPPTQSSQTIGYHIWQLMGCSAVVSSRTSAPHISI